MINPLKLVHDACKQKEEKTASVLLRERIHEALAPKNNEGRTCFIEALKLHGVPADVYLRLAQEASRDIYAFMAWENKVAHSYKFSTLQDVKPIGALSRLLIAVRALYAEDIADAISYEDAMNIVIQEALLHP